MMVLLCGSLSLHNKSALAVNFGFIIFRRAISGALDLARYSWRAINVYLLIKLDNVPLKYAICQVFGGDRCDRANAAGIA